MYYKDKHHFLKFNKGNNHGGNIDAFSNTLFVNILLFLPCKKIFKKRNLVIILKKEKLIVKNIIYTYLH